MIESLKNLDAALLLFINHLNNPVLDFIFYWISDKWVWIPFYAFLAFKVYKNNPGHFFIVLVFIAAAITLSDQISSSVIKVNTMRLRPCHDPTIASQVHLVNNYCGGQFGFVSSHAANVFALTSFLAILFRPKYRLLMKCLWIWAIVVSFSRIYLGVHFPGDVIGGAFLGILIGWLLGRIYITLILKPIIK